MRLRDWSMIFGFWFLIFCLIAARVAFHDRIAPGASHERGAVVPYITATLPG